MSIKRFKECRTCGKTEPRGWSEDKDYICSVCRNKTVGEVLGYRTLIAPRSMANKSDARAVAMARAMANDPRPAARGTQQDPMMDPTHILNPLNPFSPISPLNPLNDWDDSSHRHATSHTSAPSHDDSSSHHTSHDSSPSTYDSDSGSSYTSPGGFD